MPLRNAWTLIKGTFKKFIAVRVMQMGAALAYYTIFSLAPLLIIVLGIVGLVWGEKAAQGEIVQQVQGTVGEDVAGVVQTVVENASRPGRSIIAIVVGSIVLFIGATGVVAQLKVSLNTIWNVEPKPGRAITRMIRDRLLALAMILAIGIVLIGSMVLTSALHGTFDTVAAQVQMPGWVLLVAQYILSLALAALLIAVLFKYLPDISVQWKDIWVGATVTAVLFIIGESLLGLYLGRSTVGSAYGAAGSLVVLLLWVYYSAIMLLLGATFTQVYTTRKGAGVEPSDQARQLKAAA